MKRPDTGSCDDATIALKHTGPALSILHDACELVEARCLHYRTDAPRTALGTPADVEAKAAEFNGDFFNAYHTINPINPEFRGKNASDDDIARIRWLPYDIDPVRRGSDGLVLKGKHSATDEEKAGAWKVAETIAAFWHARGYDPLLMDSGNGYYVLVPADMSPENSVLVERLLKTHATMFNIRGATVDESTFNPSRILAMPGTIKRKGENTPERPWRMVRLLHAGSREEELDEDTLAQLLPPEPEPKPVPAQAKPGVLAAATTIGPDWMESFLQHSGIAHSERKQYRKGGKSGWKWVLSTALEDYCPNQEEHNSPNGRSTQVAFLDETGVFGFQCSHSKCGDIHWRQFRDYHEQCNVAEGRGRFREEWVEPADDAIVISPGTLNEAVDKAEALLAGRHELKYFRRGSDLVKPVQFNKRTVDGLGRAQESVVVQPASTYTVIRDVNAHAQCVNEKGKPTSFSSNLAEHVLDRVRTGEGNYRVLDMVTSSPVLLPDGTVLDRPGHRAGVLFVAGGADYPTVPEAISREAARLALRKFDAVFSKFPFVRGDGQEWHQTPGYATTLAAILSLVVRPALPTVPLFSTNATTPGTGKTKLVEACSIAALGHKPTVTSYHNETEFSKALVPLLREADRACLIDNLSVPLEGDMLCSVLTSEEHRARILGQSENVRLLNRTVFFATGNNLAIQGDLTRRALQVRLDADCEHPERRAFDFEPISRVLDMHPELAIAAVTALRGYVLAGCPAGFNRPLLGSFEVWDRLVCGCLAWLDFADPVQTMALVEASDPERDENLQLLATWWTTYREPVSIGAIAQDKAQVYDLLAQDGWNAQAVGKRLRRLEGRVLAGLNHRPNPCQRSQHNAAKSWRSIRTVK